MDTYAEHAERYYRERVAAVAKSLHDTADRLERAGTDIHKVSVTTCGPYTYAAHRAIHELMWGIANANADSLLLAAGEADAAATEEVSL